MWLDVYYMHLYYMHTFNLCSTYVVQKFADTIAGLAPSQEYCVVSQKNHNLADQRALRWRRNSMWSWAKIE